MPKYDEAYWLKLIAAVPQQALLGTLNRIVESQSQVVTLKLVDTIAEQQVLEQLLEDSKPEARLPANLHYLLRTPWRYPPLPWGSRFGTRYEASLFYGSLSLESLFAEAAYYRLVFLEGSRQPFKNRVVSQHTVFSARFNTKAGLDISKQPFSRRRKVLTSKFDYGPTQALGAALRKSEIQAFIYQSARTLKPAFNVALFTPRALRSRKPVLQQRALCEARPERVSFRHEQEIWTFERAAFLIDGQLPQPAA